LNDGEHVTLPLSDMVSNKLVDNGLKANISVHDAEGRTYNKYTIGSRNPKWGYFGSS